MHSGLALNDGDRIAMTSKRAFARRTGSFEIESLWRVRPPPGTHPVVPFLKLLLAQRRPVRRTRIPSLGAGSTLETILPMGKKLKVAMFNWSRCRPFPSGIKHRGRLAAR
jgi:hypothetical protein